MARKATGQLTTRRGKGGHVTYAVRIRAYGRRPYVTLGSSADGWTRKKAEEELQNILADVRRGIWRPPATVPEIEAPIDPGFHEFASAWYDGLADEGLGEATLADYYWQLTQHLLPFFAEHRLSQITVAEVDRYRQTKVREKRLAATSINKTITRLGQVLEVAVERDLIERNAAKVGGKRRKVKAPRPDRTYLDRADQVASLLDAAGKLDREARSGRPTSRRALLAALAFGGLRIGEALDLRWRDVDLAAGRLHIAASKTDAGVRTVELVPTLRDELLSHRARTRFARAHHLVLPTTTGGRENPSNVRNRTLARSIERANEQRQKDGLGPLPTGLTPHSLRRTFASVLFALGRELPYVMAQLGHADPKMTLGIYARVMMGGDEERTALRRLVGEGDARVASVPSTEENPANGEKITLT